MSADANYTLPPKRRRRFRVVIPLLIGAAIAIGLSNARHRHQSMVMLSEPTVATPAEVETPPAPVTIDDPAETLLADTYPSRQSAVRALASRLPEMIGRVSADPGDFRMTFEDLPAAGAPIYDAVRQQFPRAHVSTAAPKSTPSGNDVVIGLVTDPESPPSKPVASRGSVQLTVTSATRTAALSTRFAKCMWADDLADYINSHPGHTWIVARSVRIGVGAADAHRAAEENASYLVERFISQHRRRSGLPDTPNAAAMLPLPISDRFVQRFKRPYGDVWSEAILLDVSPQYLNGLEQRQNHIVAIRQTRVQTTMASLAIVLASILAAYLFVNTVTRSYFTGRLRTAAIVGAMVALSIAALLITVA